MTTSMQQFDFQPGDLAACYGTDWVSRAISYGTASLFAPRRLRIGPSHVAVICEYHGSPVWVESTSLCEHPCVILRTHVRGVQAHLPEDRIRDYVSRGGQVDLYRLSPIDRLSHAESDLLTRILVKHFIGRMVAYDMGGALLSGTRLFKRTRLLPQADLKELFCSELAAKVFMRLGRVNRDNRAVGLVNGKVKVKQLKTAKSRRLIGVPQVALDALQQRRKAALAEGLFRCEWVFPNREGGPMDKNNLVRRSFTAVLKAAGLPATRKGAGLPHVRFHDLRHTAATLMLLQGVHPKVVQERLGHASITMTMDTYSHVLQGMQRDATDQMDRMFGAATA